MKQVSIANKTDSLINEITRGLLLGATLIMVALITARPLIFSYAPPSMEKALFNAMGIAVFFILTIRAFLAGRIIMPPIRLLLPLLLLFLLGAASFRSDSCTWLIENELLNWAVTIGLFLSTWSMVCDEQYGRLIRKLLVAAIVAVTVATILHALWQYFVFLKPLRAQVQLSALAAKDMASPIFAERVNTFAARGAFEHSNALAGFLILTMPLFGAFLIYAQSQKSRAAMFVGWIFAGASILALFVTHSEGGVIGFAGGGATFAFLYFYRERIAPLGTRLLKTKRAKITAGISLSLLFLVMVFGLFSLCMQHPSFVVRVEYWKAALAMIISRPLGVGLGNFGEHYFNFQTTAGWQTREAHNVYLSLMAELGIVSIFVFGSLLVGYIKTVFKNSDEPSQPQPIKQVVQIARIFALTGGLLGLFLVFGTEAWPLAMILLTIFCWTCVFLFLTHSDIDLKILKVATIAGLAAILLHGTAEFLFRINPLMLSAAIVGALIATPNNSIAINLRKPSNAVPFSLVIILLITIVGVRGVAHTTVLAATKNAAGLSMDDAITLEAEAIKTKDSAKLKLAHRRALNSWRHRVDYLHRESADEEAAYLLAQTDDIIKRLGRSSKGSATREYKLESIFTKLIESRPSSFRARVLMANLQMRLAHYTVAENQYTQAIRLYKVNPEIHILLGDAQARFAPLKAVVTYNAALELNREVSDVRTTIFQRFWTPITRRSSAAVLNGVARARTEHGETPALWVREGIFRTTSADFVGGVDAFTKALALSPNDTQLKTFLWYATIMQLEAHLLTAQDGDKTQELEEKIAKLHAELIRDLNSKKQVSVEKSISKSLFKLLKTNVPLIKQVARGK